MHTSGGSNVSTRVPNWFRKLPKCPSGISQEPFLVLAPNRLKKAFYQHEDMDVKEMEKVLQFHPREKKPKKKETASRPVSPSNLPHLSVWILRASLFLVHLGQRSAQRGTLGRSHPGYIGHFRSTACLALALALARTYAESREL